MKPPLNIALSTLTLLTVGSFALPSLAQEVTCNDTTHARAVTKRFYVNICGSRSTPDRYVGSSKNGQSIILPLKSYGNGTYTANNGKIRYTLTPNYLKVTENGRVIVKEKIVSQGLSKVSSQSRQPRTIIVYGRNGCSRTRYALEELSRQGVRYEYKNIDNQADLNEFYQRVSRANMGSGSIGLPLVYINTNPQITVSNPNISEVISIYRR